MNSQYTRLKLYLFSGLTDNIYSLLFSPHPKYQPKRAPLFIIGSGRNGSTLLSCILNNHPKISIPVESSYIPSIIKYWYRHPFQNWETKVKGIVSLLKTSNYWKLDLEDIHTKFKTASKEEQCPSFIIETIYLHLGQKTGKQNFIWGDKTPSNTQFIKLMNAQFSGSKILFLVRDPRDYIASLIQMNSNNTHLLPFYLWRWKNSFQKYEALKSKRSNNVRMLSYENLVRNAEQEVAQVLDWLDLEMTPHLFMDYAKNMSLLQAQDLKHHENILQPINTNSIGAWKTQLNDRQIWQIEHQVGNEMKALGYTIS
jgi:hypothetical protein